jgi:hypothetical protein
MRVGLDSDGVIDNFGVGVHQTLEARGLEHLWKSGPRLESYWNFYEDWDWTFAQFKELVDWGVDEGIIFSGHFRDGAIEAVQKIKSLGHEVIIITDRAWGTDPMNSQRNTLKGFEKFGIVYDEIHFTRDKTSVYVDTMVEDKLDNYDALVANGTPTWLINRPWNKVSGGDSRNRIDCVMDYAYAIEDITRNGFVDLQIS